jgi:DNA replication and repair protein RecF
MSLCGHADAFINTTLGCISHILPRTADSLSDTITGLLSLDIVDFRNIEAARLTFSRGVNLITGPNAAGKTSLLEAIYCLGRVRSFRTLDSNQLIRNECSGYRLVGRIGLKEGRIIPIGIERQQRHFRVHLEGRAVRRLSDLASRFPIHIMAGDTANILNGGPRYRRQSLDWALFHVEHAYRDAWQRYARALRQRNAALRSHAPVAQVSVWNPELVDAAEILDSLRRRYLENLEPHVRSELQDLLPDMDLYIHYQSGWKKELPLQEVLEKTLEKDCAHGYTHAGPHRADFMLREDKVSVQARLSRGQQKTLILGFLMGQIKLQHAMNVTPGAFLLDDLRSELDSDHQARVLRNLSDLQVQVFVTAIDPDTQHSGDWSVDKVFHVKHGVIQEVI